MWNKWVKVLHFKDGFLDFVKAWCNFRKEKFNTKADGDVPAEMMETLGRSTQTIPKKDEA